MHQTSLALGVILTEVVKWNSYPTKTNKNVSSMTDYSVSCILVLTVSFYRQRQWPWLKNISLSSWDIEGNQVPSSHSVSSQCETRCSPRSVFCLHASVSLLTLFQSDCLSGQPLPCFRTLTQVILTAVLFSSHSACLFPPGPSSLNGIPSMKIIALYQSLS